MGLTVFGVQRVLRHVLAQPTLSVHAWADVSQHSLDPCADWSGKGLCTVVLGTGTAPASQTSREIGPAATWQALQYTPATLSQAFTVTTVVYSDARPT